MRVRSLERAKGPSPTVSVFKSPEEVVAARKELAEDLKRYIGGEVSNRISYLDKGLETPPDQRPSPPTEPHQQE